MQIGSSQTRQIGSSPNRSLGSARLAWDRCYGQRYGKAARAQCHTARGGGPEAV